jgi:hypothetical protein
MAGVHPPTVKMDAEVTAFVLVKEDRRLLLALCQSPTQTLKPDALSRSQRYHDVAAAYQLAHLPRTFIRGKRGVFDMSLEVRPGLLGGGADVKSALSFNVA